MPGICFGRLWPRVTIYDKLHMDFAPVYTKICMILPEFGGPFFWLGVSKRPFKCLVLKNNYSVGSTRPFETY